MYKCSDIYGRATNCSDKIVQTFHIYCTLYRIRKDIGEEVNLANWQIKIKSPIFNLANVFCTRLTQNLARDPLAVAVI